MQAKKPLMYGGLIAFIALVFGGLYKLTQVLAYDCDAGGASYACKFILFYSGGELGAEQGQLILLAFALMLIVVIPVLVMSVWFPLWYSAKGNADYKPNWSHSNIIEFFAWGIPILIIIALAYVTYLTAHGLDPKKSLVGKYENTSQDELIINAVAMDWKWVFFYPEQNIATVNEIAIPVGRPLKFVITSDTVMNSFFIPELGSQIYAMGGMETRMHLISKREKVMRGISANYSGFGFSGMKFDVISTTEDKFNDWVKKVKSSATAFDQNAYKRLRGKQTKDHPVEYFNSITNKRQFYDIIEKYLTLQDGTRIHKEHHKRKDDTDKLFGEVYYGEE